MRFVIIGNGKMCIDCVNIILNSNNSIISLVIFSEKLDKKGQLKNYLKEKNLDFISTLTLNDEYIRHSIKISSPDYILNINSFWIIKDYILSIPKIASVNFHNGYLPSYGGVNIPHWAIINGEISHGITWHIIDNGIDTGEILWQKKFYIDRNMTAGMLMHKCITEGINLFKEKFETLLDCSFVKTKQEGLKSYYSLKHKPENSGVINFNDEYNIIYNLVRGLNYLPFKNDFEYARVKSSNVELIVNKVSKVPKIDTCNSGFVLEASSSFIRVSCKDAIVQIESVMTHKFQSLNNRQVIERLKLERGNFIDNSYF